MKEKGKFNNPFVSLKHKNFRYYWIGMCISLIGTWMQNIAQPWLAYSLTESPFLLSLIGTLQFTPIMIFALFSGVIIDRFPIKKILLFTQSSLLIITFILTILVWSGEIEYWHILLMATLTGVVNALDLPSRQSFVMELAGKDNVMNAVALNSMAFNTARIIGPTIAGIIMGYFGVAICFLINSISFTAVLISLFFIKPLKIGDKTKAKFKTNIFSDIKKGLLYIFNNKVLFHTLIIIAIVGIFAPNFNVLTPVFAKEVLNQDEKGFGMFLSFLGIGSFLGAMFVAGSSKSSPKKFIIYIVPFIVGAFLIITGMSSKFTIAGICLGITGMFFVAFTSSANSMLQLNSSDEYRGRVMSVYTLVFSGTTPIGNLYAGVFSEKFNSKIGFIACGIAIIIFVGVLHIYRIKKHIKT